MTDDKKDWLARPAPGLSREDVRDGHRLVRPPFKPSVRIKPHINELLDASYRITQHELQALLEKQRAGQVLTSGEVLKFKNLTDSLTKLAREEREQEAKDDPALLETEELLRRAREAHEVLSIEVIEVKKEEK